MLNSIMLNSNLHKLVQRQVKKYLTNVDINEQPFLIDFLEAVSQSYFNFERDKVMQQNAFEIADNEYFNITQKLLAEKKIREQSINTLLSTIRNLENSHEEQLNLDSENLLSIAEYLEKQNNIILEIKERYELAISGSNDGIWDWNLKTNDVFFSDRWKSMLGYQPNEVKNSFDSFVNLLHPEDLFYANDMLNKYLTHQIPNYTIEFRMKRKDDDYAWILAKGAALFDSEGNALRMSGSHSDITEKKLAELSYELKNIELERFNKILTSLSTTPFNVYGNLENAIYAITEAAAEGFSVCRASYWKISEIKVGNDFSDLKLECIDLYEKHINHHSKGLFITATDFPNYFDAIIAGKVILAENATTNQYTKEFAESYLIPNNIKSLLDVPIRQNGIVVGILRIENTTQQLLWNNDELVFVRSLADIIALSLESDKIQTAEKDLRLLQNIINYSSDAIQVTTEEGQLFYINQVAANRLGIKQEELKNFHVRDFEEVFQDDSDWKKHVKELKRIDYQVIEGINKNVVTGNITPVEVTVKHISIDDNGYVIANSRDITERKLIELQLSEQKDYIESIITAIPDLLIIMDANGTCHQVRSGKDLILPFEPSFMIGKNITTLFPKYITHSLVESVNLVLLGNQLAPLHYELEFNHQINHYEFRITNFINNQVILLIRNISVIKKAEEDLKGLSELQNILMNIASKYINLSITEIESSINLSLAEIGNFVSADRAYIFDYDFIEKTTSNTYEWCNTDIEPEINNLQNIPMDFFPQWVEKHCIGEEFYIPNIYELPEDGPESLRGILEPQGIKSLITLPIIEKENVLGFVGFDSVLEFHQYSEKERKLLFVFAQILANLKKRSLLEANLILEKEKANAANRAKSEFLANISHEIRTPMNHILGFSEVMLNTTNDNKQKNYLSTILKSGKTLLSLINDILDLSKIEAGKMEISSEPIDMRVIFNEIKQLFEQKVKEKNIEFLLEIDDSLPNTILIDEIRLRQIILNLVGNAIKFTHNGFVKIQVIIDNISLIDIDFTISVIDTGIGISLKDFNRIFDSFSQQYGQDSRKYGGTGLGLSITKRLCELMGGEIKLESKINEGSTFSVKFTNINYSNDNTESNEMYVWNNDHIDFNGAKILVVDDVKQNRDLVKTFLEDYNLIFLEAENGEIAIEISKLQLPDFIFMDIRMQGINGYEATKVIKSLDTTSKIPIVALTASTLQSEVDLLKTLFDGYLKKPVQRMPLLNEMMKFLKFKKVENSKEKSNISQNNKKKIENKVIEEIISEDIKNEFIHLFNENLENQKNYIVIDKIDELANNLIQFATEKNLQKLNSLALELQENIELFEFDNIANNLISIKKMFE